MRITRFWFFIGIISVLSLLSSCKIKNDSLKDDNIPTLIFTNFLDPPSSFDPLDGQNQNNFYAIPALYALPLEFDDFGRYQSSILEKFRYIDKTRTLQFCLKKNRFFSDGSPITLDDLAFNIARVAKAFPNIGHLKEIEGLNDWLKLKNPLLSYPKGFELDQDSNCLNIRYTSSQPNPFYNFVCPMHGIIPKASVDLGSGKIKIFTPPFSGPYTLSKLNSDSYTLERRNTVAPANFPEKLLVKLVNVSKIGPILRDAHKNLVVITDKSSLSSSDRKLLDEKFRSPPGVENHSAGLLFNTSAKSLFSDLRLRQFFAEEFRQSVAGLGADPNGSIFTLIQPGYVSLLDLRSHLKPFAPAEREMLLKKLKEHPPIVGNSYKESFFQRALERTINRLGLKQKFLLDLPREEIGKQFVSGQIDIIPSVVFFGGLEPVEGPRIIISLCGMPSFKFVNESPALREELSKIYQTDPFTVNLEGAKNLSRVLFEDASFSIYRNFSLGTYARKDSLLNYKTPFFSMNILQFFDKVQK